MSLRILDVGNDLALVSHLKHNLEITVVSCSGQSTAKILIAGINYSAIVLDESNSGLEQFIGEVKAHQKTPVLVASGSPEGIAETVRSSLERPRPSVRKKQ